MILGKYVFFLSYLSFFLFVLLFAAIWNAGKYQNVPHIKELSKKFSETKVEEYNQIDVEKLLGDKGICTNSR